MKSYDDWLINHPYPHIGTKETYEQIQLDAWQQGMTDAAQIIWDANKSILTDRDNKKEI